MTTFNDREKAAENKYAHDKEMEFRIQARRSKLMGQWAAGRMSLSGAAADDYTKSLIAASVSDNDDNVLISRVKSDLSARGVSMSEQEVKEELHRVTQIAKDQIQDGKKA